MQKYTIFIQKKFKKSFEKGNFLYKKVVYLYKSKAQNKGF